MKKVTKVISDSTRSEIVYESKNYILVKREYRDSESIEFHTYTKLSKFVGKIKQLLGSMQIGDEIGFRFFDSEEEGIKNIQRWEEKRKELKNE